MTAALSCKNEDHVGFEYTPGSVLMSIMNKNGFSKAPFDIMSGIVNMDGNGNMVVSYILMALLCFVILKFVQFLRCMFLYTHNVWHILATPVFSLRGVGSFSLENDVFRVCLDVKATLTGSFLTEVALIPNTYSNTRVIIFSSFSGWFLCMKLWIFNKD